MTMRRALLVGVQVLACMGAATASVRAQGAAPASVAAPRPALEPLRITGEVVVGNIAGLGGYFVGQALGNHIASRWPDQNEHTSVFITTGFAYTGAAFATAGGVYAVGSMGDQRGSFSATMLGTGVGAGVAWVLDRTLFSDIDDTASGSRTRWAQTLLNSLLPSIGATIGFNSSRRF
ncbi:hypothetical protein EBR44_09700 [bacterium]|nr:hypothetical protein [bacterium]